MMKTFLTAMALLIMATAAQAQQASGQKIVVARKDCAHADKFAVPTVRHGGGAAVPASRWTPEWKETCEKIEAEYAKRDLAKKARDASEKARLDDVAKRIGQ